MKLTPERIAEIKAAEVAWILLPKNQGCFRRVRDMEEMVSAIPELLAAIEELEGEVGGRRLEWQAATNVLDTYKKRSQTMMLHDHVLVVIGQMEERVAVATTRADTLQSENAALREENEDWSTSSVSAHDCENCRSEYIAERKMLRQRADTLADENAELKRQAVETGGEILGLEAEKASLVEKEQELSQHHLNKRLALEAKISGVLHRSRGRTAGTPHHPRTPKSR